jgi:hypothetical protein
MALLSQRGFCSLRLHQMPENVFAFAFNNGIVNGANPLLSAIGA